MGPCPPCYIRVRAISRVCYIRVTPLYTEQEIKPKKGKPKRRKFNKDLVPPPFDNMIVSTERCDILPGKNGGMSTYGS